MIADFPPLCKIKAQKKMPNFPGEANASCIKRENRIHFLIFSPSYDFLSLLAPKELFSDPS